MAPILLSFFTREEWFLLAVGLVCIGPLAMNVAYLIWWLTVKPDKMAQLREEIYVKRCHECGHQEKQRMPFCPRCGAFTQFPSQV